MNKAKWNPIETAPEDGTKVLLIATIYSTPPKPVMVVGWYSRGWWTYANATLSHVSHWMPLPEKPPC